MGLFTHKKRALLLAAAFAVGQICLLGGCVCDGGGNQVAPPGNVVVPPGGDAAVPGKVWETLDVPRGAWQGVAYGNGVWVIAGRSFTDPTIGGSAQNRIARSVDGGRSWTVVMERGANEDFMDVIYGGGVFIAINYDGGFIWRSEDLGATWEKIALPADIWALRFGVYGDGVFVIAGHHGRNPMVRSEDLGKTWQFCNKYADGGQITSWQGHGMAYSDRDKVFVGVADKRDDRFLRSADGGKTWEIVKTRAQQWSRIAYGDGVFVAVAREYDAEWQIISSSNGGRNWSVLVKEGRVDWSAAAYGDGVFVAAGTGKIIWSADNGLTWDESAAPDMVAVIDLSGLGAAYGEGKFILVSAATWTVALRSGKT